MTGIKAIAQVDGTGRERGVLQLKASGERHDGLCPRCLAEGIEETETMLHTVRQCLSCSTGGIFSEGSAAFWSRRLLVANWTAVGNSETNVGSDDVGPRHQVLRWMKWEIEGKRTTDRNLLGQRTGTAR